MSNPRKQIADLKNEIADLKKQNEELQRGSAPPPQQTSSELTELNSVIDAYHTLVPLPRIEKSDPDYVTRRAYARQAVHINQLVIREVGELMRLDSMIASIHTATVGYSDHDLIDYLKDKPAELVGQLMRCQQACETGLQSLSATRPQIISGVQAHVERINLFLKTGQRAPLREAVWQRSDDLGDLAKTLFTETGGLRREREPIGEREYIGLQLLGLEAAHTLHNAAEIILEDLQAEAELGELSPTKQMALLILKDLLNPTIKKSESTIRVTLKRYRDTAAARRKKNM